MKFKNSQLYPVLNYLQSLTLPAQVSRAKTKIVGKINDILPELSRDENDLIVRFNGQQVDQGVDFGTIENRQAYQTEWDKLMNETVIITISEYPTLEQALKDYFMSYDGDIAPEYADAFDAFYDALEIEENEEN